MEKFRNTDLPNNNKSFDPDKRVEPEERGNINQRESFDPDKRVEPGENKETEVKYYTDHEYRLKHIPKSDGKWMGERGESKFIPDSEEAREKLKEYGLDGIEYKDAIPDFSKIAKETVTIDNMTNDRKKNFKQFDIKCAEKWNQQGFEGRKNWTPREIESWRKENLLTWHENSDMKTGELVPRVVHDACHHTGGIAECNKKEKMENGGKFDE